MINHLGAILFHPAIVHFPIALLLCSTVCILLFIYKRNEYYLGINRFLLLAGLIGAFIAIITGMVDEFELNLNQMQENLLSKHEITAYLATTFYVVKFFWLLSRKRIKTDKELYFITIISVVGAILLIYQGYLGGKMVYSHGIGVNI